MIIAGGHRRYEPAINYSNECRTAVSANSSKDAPHEFVMMTFVNMNSPGLLVLPTHRVVRGLTSFSADDFEVSSRNFFQVEEIDSALDAPGAAAILREKGTGGPALLAVTANRAFLLHQPKADGQQLAGLSERQQTLDVVQLHKRLLE